MKKSILTFALLSAIISNSYINALDTGTYEFIDMLLSLKKPGAPVVYEDGVVFTASSIYKRVGIAFEHEGFSKIHNFKKLLVPINDTAVFDGTAKNSSRPELFQDSGLLFYVYEVPSDLKKLEYRLVIEGLWTEDPYNPEKRLDRNTGLIFSGAPVPNIVRTYPTAKEDSTELSFSYKGRSGESITVAGDFNGWDPFMYDLKESAGGIYSLNLPIPQGTWKYVFFRNGERVLDPNNNSRVYTYDGKIANVVTVK
ncbi:MAG: hypothetical protein Ta2G_13630 [Termitinemataceae bacterium]|nr:MAG: hypothetical protein Ta2G_13630 [Termitinemataceae bacterium]